MISDFKRNKRGSIKWLQQFFSLENELKKSEGEIEVICFAARPHYQAPYQSELSINSEVALVTL